MPRFSPMVGGGLPSLSSPLRARLSRTLRTNAKPNRKRKGKRKPAKKRAGKKKAAAKARNARRTPRRGGKRGKRGGTVKPTGKFEHLRVRAPSSFKKTTFKTIPWAWVPDYEQRFIKKKLGLRTIPRGTKAVSGTFKPGAKKDRIPGKRVKYYAHGVQTLLVPITGGKKPKSPRGTKRKSKKAARKITKRATRQNHHTTKAGRGKYAKVCVKVYGPIAETDGATRRNPAKAPKRRKWLAEEIEKLGAEKVYQSLARLQRSLAAAGHAGHARTVQLDLDWIAKTYKLGPTKKAPRMPYSRRPRNGNGRPNPGRLCVVNPLPKGIEASRKRMGKAQRRKFDQLLGTLSRTEVRELDQAARGYKRFHGQWPTELIPIGKTDSDRRRFRYGLGKADHVGYHTNTKKYKGSSKTGVPFRHHFENGQELVATADGKRLAVVNRRKRGTKTTNWIRG